MIAKTKKYKKNNKKSKKQTQKKVLQRGGNFPLLTSCTNDLGNITYDVNNVNKKIIKDEHGDTKYLLVYIDEKKDEIVLNKKVLIAQGNYGAVYKISDETEKIKFAAKTYFDQDDSEITILEKLSEKNVECNILSCKLLKTKFYDNQSQEKYISICELYNGELNVNIIKKMTISTKLGVILKLAKDLKCLLNKGFYYTDIKIQNTLYKCLEEKIKVTLGDVGSICDDSIDCIATFPPFEDRDSPAEITTGEKQIVWGLGILLLCLLHNKTNITQFAHNFFNRNVTEEDAEKAIDKYNKNYYDGKDSIASDKIKIQGNVTLMEIIKKNILNLDPKERFSLTELINLLETPKYRVSNVVKESVV